MIKQQGKTECENNNELDGRISSFLLSQTNFTLAVSENNKPYCANCFYAYDLESNRLIFKSKLETTHIVKALKNNCVAGTITPDLLDKTRIQGIQFEGVFFQVSGEKPDKAKSIYYKKYPFALTISGELWVIELGAIKFTDNIMGFGKNINWRK
jgi:uncharacterized protein